MRIRMVIFLLGVLQIFVGLSMIFPFLCALYYGDGDARGIFVSMCITVGIGGILAGLFHDKQELRAREGFMIVTGGWVGMSLFGTLPYLLTGASNSFVDALFETISGFTTTGATIFPNVEILPHGVLFWRSETHWIGGMGIIVLSLAVLPFLGVGGMQLFKAEVPGHTIDKLSPRIGQTAKLLWGVYILLSAVQVILLKIGGMSFFDACCHMFGSMGTGGFSTKNLSVGAYNSSYIEYVIIIFMFLAGANFSLHYRALRGSFSCYRKDWEFLLYCIVIVTATIFISLQIGGVNYSSVEPTIRSALFQVVSICTTTGFGTADYCKWSFASQFVIFLLMFIGGCTGSTGGSIKVMRIGILLKNSIIEIKRLVHPNAVIPVKMRDTTISPEIIYNIMGFFLLYLGVYIIGVLVLTLSGVDLLTAFGASSACLGNIGPGLGQVGPASTYANIPIIGKIVLSISMLLGRLELYTVLVIFSKSFWKV